MISAAVHCICQTHPQDPPLRTKSLSTLQELIPSHSAVTCAQPENILKVTLSFICRLSFHQIAHFGVSHQGGKWLLLFCVMLIY